MRLSRLVFAWLVVLLLGAVVQLPSASGATAHAAHQHAPLQHVLTSVTSDEAAIQGAPARLHAAKLQQQAEYRASSGGQAPPCPVRCGECEASGGCCPAGGMTLLGSGDVDIHVAMASASRRAMPQDDMPASGPVYLIPRPPKPVG
jgi:hypothetical protein